MTWGAGGYLIEDFIFIPFYHVVFTLFSISAHPAPARRRNWAVSGNPKSGGMYVHSQNGIFTAIAHSRVALLSLKNKCSGV